MYFAIFISKIGLKLHTTFFRENQSFIIETLILIETFIDPPTTDMIHEIART